ncbi:uncharacterized protein LOC113367920 [Ctenocephalides felis]|uniref:uncharacterized protein LOC113367920 n=1 Tax=Ctenocephalides felis TaxID=7515 RepID=UPI000E6E588E|nr:uncharacterized protein LOC113367920 [Ctenocephalides felis]
MKLIVLIFLLIILEFCNVQSSGTKLYSQYCTKGSGSKTKDRNPSGGIIVKDFCTKNKKCKEHCITECDLKGGSCEKNDCHCRNKDRNPTEIIVKDFCKKNNECKEHCITECGSCDKNDCHCKMPK